ncbi:MAG TPA: alpha/beta hydrolase [Jatrophihabitantaceae bacterium]|jgi:pimeloyl-ACP methyl ester carboxylesterase
MATYSQSRLVDSGDGRRLRVQAAGDGDRVILAQLGTPNAGVLFGPWVDDALRRGLRLVTYDRPGYGGSSPQPGRIVADCVEDVRAIAFALGFARCAVWGFSGGGPHALACAALAGDLVSAVGTIGSPAPPDAAGLDYFAGMSDEARQDIELLRTDRAEWERISAEQREAALAMTAAELVESWSHRKAPADRAALRGEFGAWLHRAVQDGMTPAKDGVLDDNVAIFHARWGFELASISVPVKVWHGAQDRFVPWQHGRWIVEQIHAAEADLNDRDGHMTVAAERIGDVHAWLARYV